MSIAFSGSNRNSKLLEINGLNNNKINELKNVNGGWSDYRAFPSVFPQNSYIDIFKPQVEEKKAPEIGWARVLFSRLTDDQIAQVNETKLMPKNAKVVEEFATGKPRLTWNLFDITPGTHTLPAGYELKKGILGFTHLVREGTQAWYLKK